MSTEDEKLARQLLEFAISLYPDQKRGWQTKFAKRLGVTPQQLSDMLNGRKGIGEVQQRRLADLGMSLNWLIAGKGSMLDPEIPDLDRTYEVSINDLEGAMISDVEISFPARFRGLIKPPAIRLVDDSMAGYVWADDTIFISKDEEVASGDLCLVQLKGEGYIVRHIHLQGNAVVLTRGDGTVAIIKASQLLSARRVVCANISGTHLRKR